MSFEASVTHWLQAYQAGDREAVRWLWQRYSTRMVSLARSKLDGSPCAAADEEDVALSAVNSFCQGVEQGQFPRLQDRDDLRRPLVVITDRKAVNLIHHEGRLERRADHAAETDDQVLQGILSREPSPANLTTTKSIVTNDSIHSTGPRSGERNWKQSKNSKRVK